MPPNEKNQEILQDSPNAEIDRLWGEEAEGRVEQIAQGEVELVSGEEVFDRIRKQCDERDECPSRGHGERGKSSTLGMENKGDTSQLNIIKCFEG